MPDLPSAVPANISAALRILWIGALGVTFIILAAGKSPPTFAAQNTTRIERLQLRLQQRGIDHPLHPAAPDQAFPSSAAPASAMRSHNATGIYLTAGSVGRREFFDETLRRLQESGGNAVVFDVKGSAVYFHSAATVANEVNLVRPLYELPEILRIAKEQGIYTIGRFIAIKDAGFTDRVPASRIRDPKSGRVLSETWVDPADEDAIVYNTQIICELSRMGIDEINLDYIRFSTAEVGALRVYSGTEKADRLEKYIRAVREQIDHCGPKTRLGLSTYAILGWNFPVNFETLGQDIARFAPMVDIISPMAYPATFAAGHYYDPAKNPGSRMYYLVYRTLQGYKDLLGPGQSHKLRPWIQGYSANARDISDEIRAVYDAGLCGFTVWNASNAYDNSYAAFTRTIAERPERCRN